MKKYLLLLVYTLLFSLLLIIGQSIFFDSSKFEEQFVEQSIGQNSPTLEEGSEYYEFHTHEHTHEHAEELSKEILYENIKNQFADLNQDKVRLRYIPLSFKNDLEFNYTPLAQVFLFEPDIIETVKNMGVYFYKNIGDTRGRMKGKNIHMFGVEQMSDEEFLGVLIHEFAHYFDIHSFERTSFGDTSYGFYDISWESVSVMSPGQDFGDFVSGYAMTNQYEDFAETYLYYIMHNEAFQLRAQASSQLQQKYDFIEQKVFQDEQFKNINFGEISHIQEYYWDITKIPLDVKNFLQYLQNSI